MSEENKSLKSKLEDRWDSLTPKKRQGVIFGGVALVFVLVFLMMDSGKSSAKDNATSKVANDANPVAVFGNGDQQADIESISAQQNATISEINSLQLENEELRNLVRELEQDVAKTKVLTGDPEIIEEIATKLDELSSRQKEFEKFTNQSIGKVKGGVSVESTDSSGDEIISLGSEDGNEFQEQATSDELDLFGEVSPGNASSTESIDLIGGNSSGARVARKDAEEAIISASSKSDPYMGETGEEGIEPSYGVHIFNEVEESAEGGDDKLRSADPKKGNTTRDMRLAAKSETQKTLFLNAGSVLKGTLINGLVAPTGDTARSHPMPVNIQVSSEALMPNNFVMDLRGCQIIGSAYGDESSERVHVRTELLSCRWGEDEQVETAMDGWISGEDGRIGLKGRLVTKEGKMLYNAGVAGLLAGLGEGLKPERVNSVRTGQDAGDIDYQAPPLDSVVGNGVQSGLAKGSTKISEYYLDKADALFAVIEIDAMREVVINLKKGVKIKLENLAEKQLLTRKRRN